MRISELYRIGKTQAELDFVDIDINKDIALFLDPHFLGQRNDRWSYSAVLTLRSFFQTLINWVREGNHEEAIALFEHLHEVNSTCLGLSIGVPEGRGVGPNDSSKIFSNILASRAIQTGLLQDLEDNVLFVDNFGKDKLSDMTTNIIRKHLIDYTKQQCILHDIPLTPNTPSGFFWDREIEEWRNELTDMLVVENRVILLVPKAIVSFSNSYVPDQYYTHFVLTYLQNEQIRLNTALVKRRKSGNLYVTKKDLKEQFPLTKEFLRRFTERHPEVLEEFKRRTGISPLKNFEITDINTRELAKILGEQLVGIPSGTAEASSYHKKILGILELLFYPKLINPIKEQEIHQGRKRIDIVFDNAANSGVFHWIPEKFRLVAPYIYVECKNYSKDPSNPEVDQLSGRFSSRNGKVGLLVCRKIEEKKLFYRRCTDTYSDDRGLIIPLDDQDIINLLDNFKEVDDSFLENYLTKIIKEITM